MKKLMSFFLAFVICCSMIPGVAAAETSAPENGVYLAQLEGNPAGACMQMTERTVSGNTGEVKLPGYWDIPYTPGEEKVIYYYHAEATVLTARNNDNVSVEQMDAGGQQSHFWKICLSQNASGEQWVDFNYRIDENADGNFVVTFAANAPQNPPSDPPSDPPAYANGIYLAMENDAPAGTFFAGDRPDADGPWGYYGIAYNSSAEKVIYYYDTEASFLALDGDHSPLYVYIESVAPSFWRITLRAPQAGFGDCQVNLKTRDGDGGFPVFFSDTFAPTYDERGLYYRKLSVQEGDFVPDAENGPTYIPGSVFENGTVYFNDPLVMEPYTNRKDISVYFHDGNGNFTPVSVQPSKGLSIDLFDISQHSDRYTGAEEETGWYMIMAYDFTVGHLEYTHPEDGRTYKLQLKATRLPMYAFYAQDAASHDDYRMYQIMEPNTSPEEAYKDYKYSTKLYLKAANSRFDGFTTDGVIVSCGQQLYDERGFMMDWIDDQGAPHFLKPMEHGTDYDYTLEVSNDHKTITATVYANESDLNFRVESGLSNDWWGAYVNLLAADGSSPLALNLGNQGEFESAKFLPVHLFKQLNGKSVKLTQPGFAGSLTLDGNAVGTVVSNSVDNYNEETNEGSISGVALSMGAADGATEAQDAAVDQLAGVDTTPLMTLEFDISLPGGQLGGNATVSHLCDSESVPAGTEVGVYYVNEQGVASVVDGAAYENNAVTFTTDHFSTYVVAAKPTATAPAPDPGPSSDSSSRPGIKPVKPAEPEKPAVPDFADVADDHWANDAITWAAEQGYVNGTSGTEFSPENNVSRQQIWMMLSRVSGKNAADMAAAREWAVENNISDGTNPGAAVTRQQLVTLLYRYAVLMGYDVSVGEDTNILSYDDIFSVSEYAIPAFQWGCGAGVVNGTTESTLSPLGTATRAQFAVMLQRFCEKVVK